MILSYLFWVLGGSVKSILLTPIISVSHLVCKPEGHAQSLHILGDTCFKFPSTSSNNQDSTISLRCAYNHIFYHVSVSWGISEGPIILAGLEFPQGDISGDTTFTCSFQLIQDPGILEGAFSHLSSLLLKFFDSFFVASTTFVDQRTSSHRLA
ncbi:unnamed protein product [Gulo gulo]|uniref:Uncharacterized protein n=1 Tax=Gulo gulo TaxID=48420 RepID=A0A9X9LE23_GULGU|nr:unnamed protein product [Gulo gulo]